MRDDFSEDVKRVLAQRASNTCSRCEATTSGPQDNPSKFVNVGVAAHITAASPDGARYDPTLTPEQRRSAENGIWLCQTCAKLVDNDAVQFPTKILNAWKTVREYNASRALGQTPTPRTETENEKKCRKIADWVGKKVMLVKMPNQREQMSMGPRPWAPIHTSVLDCNEFFVTLNADGWDKPQTIPLDNIKFGWDSRMNCIEILQYSH